MKAGLSEFWSTADCAGPDPALPTILELRARFQTAEPAVVFDQFWKPVAEEQLRRRQQNSRPTHHLVQLPHVSRRSASLLGPLSGLLVDG
jgi:hypothetical protein